MTQTQWDELFSPGNHPKLPKSGIPVWYYEWNYCTDCNMPLMLCKDNPYGFRGHIYQERKAMATALREQARLEREQAQEQSSNSSAKDFSETDAQKPKGKQRLTRISLDADEEPVVLSRYDKKELGVVALAKEYNVPAKYMSEFLKANGREVKKGQGGGIIKAIARRKEIKAERAKTVAAKPPKPKRIKKPVPALTDALLKSFIERYEQGEKISTFVEESKIPQVMISAAFKAAGIKVRRGNPKHWKQLTAA